MNIIEQLDVSVLPQNAQEELYDFFLSLKQRYLPETLENTQIEDGVIWDKQIEADITAGKLDALANTALLDHHAGKSKNYDPFCQSRFLV